MCWSAVPVVVTECSWSTEKSKKHYLTQSMDKDDIPWHQTIEMHLILLPSAILLAHGMMKYIWLARHESCPSPMFKLQGKLQKNYLTQMMVIVVILWSNYDLSWIFQNFATPFVMLQVEIYNDCCITSHKSVKHATIRPRRPSGFQWNVRPHVHGMMTSKGNSGKYEVFARLTQPFFMFRASFFRGWVKSEGVMAAPC